MRCCAFLSAHGFGGMGYGGEADLAQAQGARRFHVASELISGFDNTISRMGLQRFTTVYNDMVG